MDIGKWIEKAEKTIRGFAAEIVVDDGALSRLVRGKRRPTFEQVVKVYVATGGEVGLEDWIVLNKAALVEAGVIKKGWKPNGR